MLAEDCVAETFSRFLRYVQKKRRDSIDNPKAYLYRTAHNWIVDQYRGNQITQVELDPESTQGFSENLETQAEAHFQRETLSEAILHLPKMQQQVILLRYLEEWSLDDVAAALHRSVGAVKLLQHRGVKSLRKYLGISKKGKHDE